MLLGESRYFRPGPLARRPDEGWDVVRQAFGLRQFVYDWCCACASVRRYRIQNAPSGIDLGLLVVVG